MSSGGAMSGSQTNRPVCVHREGAGGGGSETNVWSSVDREHVNTWDHLDEPVAAGMKWGRWTGAGSYWFCTGGSGPNT